LAGFASRKFFTCCLLSRQLRSSVYVCEKVCDFTQPIRSSAGKFDQFLVSSSRVRCSLARQLFTLSLGVWLNPAEPAARQLAVRSQFGTPSATAARVRRAKASVGQNEMPSAEAAARAIISRRNMTPDISQTRLMACHYDRADKSPRRQHKN
jgi:nitrite reductase/ring-hydroxylating ferredoxin subunit